MEDFLKDSPDEKEICKGCKFDYLNAPECRKCQIDKFITTLMDDFFHQEDFAKAVTYNGINLGELARYDLHLHFAQYFLSRMT